MDVLENLFLSAFHATAPDQTPSAYGVSPRPVQPALETPLTRCFAPLNNSPNSEEISMTAKWVGTEDLEYVSMGGATFSTSSSLYRAGMGNRVALQANGG